MTEHQNPLGIAMPMGAASPESLRATVASISARDPAFNLDAFLAEAQQAFWLVGQAHAQCKPELCQSVLSPSLAERETASIQQACQEGTIRAPRDEDASSGQLVAIESDPNRDTATVHFASVWKPVRPRRGDKEERRVENWCFQRLASVRTELGAEGDRCHNCGGSLTSSAGRCRYCGTPISADGGWRVIRVDEVGQQEAAQAVSAMREIVASVVAARQAVTEAPPRAEPVPARRRSTFSSCFSMLAFATVVAVAVVLAAVGGGGSLHRAVAKVLPPIRYPVLKGQADLSGRVVARQVTLTQVVPHFHTGGTCAKEAQRTAWDFKGKLPDGSTFQLEIGLPPAAGGPGTYHRPPLTITADAQNKSSFVSWTAAAASTATLVERADGSGDVQFANLAAGHSAGGGPLTGHLVWTCSLG